jgi:hypothetical protein
MPHPKHRRWLDTVLSFLEHDDVVRFEFDGTEPDPDLAWRRIGPPAFEPHSQQLMRAWVEGEQARR